MSKDAKAYVVGWLLLCALAVLSLLVSYANLHVGKIVLCFAIAIAQGAIVTLVFGHLGSMASSVKVAGLVALVLLLTLIVLMTGDPVTRYPAPVLPPSPAAAGGIR